MFVFANKSKINETLIENIKRRSIMLGVCCITTLLLLRSLLFSKYRLVFSFFLIFFFLFALISFVYIKLSYLFVQMRIASFVSSLYLFSFLCYTPIWRLFFFGVLKSRGPILNRHSRIIKILKTIFKHFIIQKRPLT